MDNTKEKITIYVTRYALTTGIFKVEAEINRSGSYMYRPDSSYCWCSVSGKDAHLTEIAALTRAEEMRISKLKALDKQMKKVSAMKFEVK